MALPFADAGNGNSVRDSRSKGKRRSVLLPQPTQQRQQSRLSLDNPFVKDAFPPLDESPDARQQRVNNEEAAAKRSKAIDESMQEAKRNLDKRKRAIKVLLLGQAESGKSTTLKNFQLAFAPSQFEAERSAWRAVVQFNLVQSVRCILDALNADFADSVQPSASSTSTPFTQQSSAGTVGRTQGRARSPSPSQLNALSASFETPLTTDHKKLTLRLGALLEVEMLLARKINPDAPGIYGRFSPNTTDPFSLSDEENIDINVRPLLRQKSSRELVVQGGFDWKKSFLEMRSAAASRVSRHAFKRKPQDQLHQYISAVPATKTTANEAAEHGDAASLSSTTDDPTAVISACREDINALWSDPVVREVLKRRKIDVSNMPGFFLDDVDRVARADYVPTIDDILRARLRTNGVEEHYMTIEAQSSTGESKRDWIFYDVGGCRGNRNTWAPFFDDIQAIIFLAPLVFNQTLEEDRSVNRLEDSIMLWKKICGNRLLARSTLVLFLNKMDVLQSVLKSGVRVKDYVPSYGDQPNEAKAVAKYFRTKFKAFYKSNSTQPRYFFCHETAVVDSQSTAAILVGVREGIVHASLKEANVL